MTFLKEVAEEEERCGSFFKIWIYMTFIACLLHYDFTRFILHNHNLVHRRRGFMQFNGGILLSVDAAVVAVAVTIGQLLEAF